MRSVACYNKKRASVSKSRFVSTENMKQNCNGIEPYNEAISVDGVEFCQDDILLANIRPYLKKAWKAEFNGACSTDVLSIKPIGINADFFFHCIEKDDFFNYVSQEIVVQIQIEVYKPLYAILILQGSEY